MAGTGPWEGFSLETLWGARLDAMASGEHTPLLVGRQREQLGLSERLSAALTGSGALVLIGGEAGIGKTALAEAVCRAAAAEGALVLVGHGDDRDEPPPYGPWIELFRGYPAPGTGGSAELPPLPPEFDLSGAPPAGLAGAAAASARHDAIAAGFEAVTRVRPVVLLLDDLHWFDPGSFELVRVLGRRLERLRMLVLATYRHEALTPDHPLSAGLARLVREARAARIDLCPLSDGEVRTLLTLRFGDLGEAQAALLRYLQERAEGNPLFIGELLRDLVEGGALEPTAAGWRLHELTARVVPRLLQGVVHDRVARLGPEAARALALAATIGSEVPLALWATVAGLDDEALAALVERAEAAGILVAAPAGDRVGFRHPLLRQALHEAVSPVRRRLWHRQIGEALLAEAAPAPASGYPEAIAYHLHQAGDPRAVGWLIEAGERAERAYAYRSAIARYEQAERLLRERGDEPRRRGRLLYRLAELLVSIDPERSFARLDEAEAVAREVADRELLAQITYQRGLLLAVAGEAVRGVAEMGAGLVEAEALAPEERDPGLAGLVSATTRPLIEQRSNLAGWLAQLGRLAEARALIRRLVEDLPVPDGGPAGDWWECWLDQAPAEALPPALDPVQITALAHAVGRGTALVEAIAGQPERARRALRRARHLYRSVGDALMAGNMAALEIRVLHLPYRADRLDERAELAGEAEAVWRTTSEARGDRPPRVPLLPLLWLEGAWGEAEALARASLGRSEAGARLVAARCLSAIAWARGDLATAGQVIRDALPAGPATEPGSLSYLPARQLILWAARLAVEAGDLAAAARWLDAHARWFAWNDAVLGRADELVVRALLQQHSRRATAARRLAEEALAAARQPRQPLTLIESHRLLGELLGAQGDAVGGRFHLERARELAEACAAPYEQAMAALALAELLRASDAGAAGRALAEARALAMELGATRLLGRIDALDRESAPATPAAAAAGPLSRPAGLSEREIEILRLIARGQTNRQIAEALHLSPKTVGNHVARLLAKTELPNRAALAAFALRHGLDRDQ